MIKYVPILGCKPAERNALENMASEVKQHVLPFMEVCASDATLKKFPDAIQKLNLQHGIMLDAVKSFSSKELCTDTLTKLLQSTFIKNLPVIPVLKLQHAKMQVKDEAVIKASASTFGLCFRLNMGDLINPDFSNLIKQHSIRYGNSREKTTCIIDLGAYTPSEQAAKLATLINNIPWVSFARDVILASTAFPQSMAGVKKPYEILPRKDWDLFQLVASKVPNLIFGDYSIRPIKDDFLGDPSVIKVPNRVIYTTDSGWLIYKGNLNSKSPNGLAEYGEICKFIIDSEYFMGKDYSYGDLAIYNCGMSLPAIKKGQKQNGNIQRWIEAGTNHHITKVVNDLAKMDGA